MYQLLLLLIHQNFHLHKACVNVTSHLIRYHTSECNQSVGHAPNSCSMLQCSSEVNIAL